MRTILLVLLIIAGTHLHSQEKYSNLESIGQLTDSIERIMDERHIPGMMLSIVTKDSILFQGGLGYAHLEDSVAVNDKHLFRLGSITKSFASLAILKLVKNGKISLEYDLKSIAPEVPFHNPWEETHPVKVKHLLQHTTGFDDMHFKAIYNTGDSELPALEMVKLHGNSLTSRWKPGTRFAYSNPGYVIATYLIEKFSGKTYHEYIKEVLFDPIGMEDTDMISFPGDDPQYAQGYAYALGRYNEVPFYAIHGGAAGTLNSNAADMARYVQFFLNEGFADSVQLFSPNELTLMETPSTTLHSDIGMKLGYGHGNFTTQMDRKVIIHGHDGGIDGFVSSYGYNRDHGIGYALSVNTNSGTGSFTDLIVDFLTRDVEAPEPPAAPVDPELLSEYLGYYNQKSPRNQLFEFINRVGSGFRLYIKDDTLYRSNFLEAPTTFIYAGDLMIRGEDENHVTGTLTKNDDGTPVMLNIGRYYEKNSYLSIIALRVLFFGGLAFMVSAGVAGLVWIIMALMKKIRKEDFRVRILPSIASLFMVITIVALFSMINDLTKLSTMNLQSVLLFLGSLLFGIFAILSFVVVIYRRKMFSNIWLKGYLFLCTFFIAAFAIYMMSDGWVGLRLWDY